MWAPDTPGNLELSNKIIYTFTFYSAITLVGIYAEGTPL